MQICVIWCAEVDTAMTGRTLEGTVLAEISWAQKDNCGVFSPTQKIQKIKFSEAENRKVGHRGCGGGSER